MSGCVPHPATTRRLRDDLARRAPGACHRAAPSARPGRDHDGAARRLRSRASGRDTHPARSAAARPHRRARCAAVRRRSAGTAHRGRGRGGQDPADGGGGPTGGRGRDDRAVGRGSRRRGTHAVRRLRRGTGRLDGRPAVRRTGRKSAASTRNSPHCCPRWARSTPARNAARRNSATGCSGRRPGCWAIWRRPRPCCSCWTICMPPTRGRTSCSAIWPGGRWPPAPTGGSP